MTTILTDGRIIYADRRATTDVDDNTSELKQNDDRTKVLLTNNKNLTVCDMKIKAIGGAGGSVNRIKIYKALSQIKQPIALESVLSIMHAGTPFVASNSLLCLVEPDINTVVKVSINASGISYKKITIPDGRYFGIGSGATIAAALERAAPCQFSLNDIFITGVTLDNCSSGAHIRVDTTAEKVVMEHLEYPANGLAITRRVMRAALKADITKTNFTAPTGNEFINA